MIESRDQRPARPNDNRYANQSIVLRYLSPHQYSQLHWSRRAIVGAGTLWKNNVKDLFERYEKLFRMALEGQVDIDQVTSSYATAFVAASPGASVGRNDEHLKQIMQQGFENYRQIGTKDMRFRNVRVAYGII